MKILLTGGSSFTGYWFIKELAAAGHEVVAVFRRGKDDYTSEPGRTRAAMLRKLCRPVHNVSFGDDRFVDLIGEGGWDVLCHHGTETANYKSPDFDVPAALAANAFRLPSVIRSLQKAGCGSIVLTASVFGYDEGAGSADLHAFSPYGLSKGLTWQTFRYYAHAAGMRLRKFVIPNPVRPVRGTALHALSDAELVRRPQGDGKHNPPTFGTTSMFRFWRRLTATS